MDIGIDLGTTFSVIAVRGEVSLVKDYPPPMYLPECNVTLLPAPEGNYTFPSVLCPDPKGADSVIIGIDAVQQAEQGLSPIMFSKRAIGTNLPLKSQGDIYTAKEVAVHILKYLKFCAELALGQTVNRAVVTHPAYFDRNQIQQTKEAAEAAGLDMGLPAQMMMEPVAAALAYIQSDERDPLRVMSYDLGGGTFDVTVLERSQGVITVKAFDGDHLLGGYNFDRALVQWLMDRLAASGRQIPFNKDDPQDQGRWSRLMQLAEGIKIKLSNQRTAKVYVPIQAPHILVDKEGRKVQILDRINREEYAALIKEQLDHTVECCHRALGKADMKAEDLDMILMVGGSTHGPWVWDAVKEAFAADVEAFNPDLCVAAGAALAAAQLPQSSLGSGIQVVMELPEISVLPTIHVAGVVKSEDGRPLEPSSQASLRVLLTPPGGNTLDPCRLQADGGFLFKNIDLDEEQNSAFTIQVLDDKNTERFVKTYQVAYEPEGRVNHISNVLPKPLYAETAQGMMPMAKADIPLPAKCELNLKRLHSDAQLRIAIFQEDENIGVIEVTNIPADAGVGAPIQLILEITQNNEIRGKAKILTRTGSVAVDHPVSIRFPPVKLPELSQLRTDYADLRYQLEQLEVLSEDPKQRLLLAGRGKKLIKALNKLFSELNPDVQEIYRDLKKLRHMIDPPVDDMDLPQASFRQTIEGCDSMLTALGTDPQVQPFRTMLRRFEIDGNDAFHTKNHRKWAVANDNLAKLQSRLQKIGNNVPGVISELPETPILKDEFQLEVEEIWVALKAKRMKLEPERDYAIRLKARGEQIADHIKQIEMAIDQVDESLEARRGLAKLQLAMRAKSRILNEIANWEYDAGEGR